MRIARKIIGFLPLVFWLFMLYLGGISTLENAADWHITAVPKTLWIWASLSLASGVMLCFDSLITCGLIIGAMPSVYLFISVVGSKNFAVMLLPALLVLFYAVYALLHYIGGGDDRKL